MPTLAESERPDDDAEDEVGVAVPELVAVCLEPGDASAVDAELEMGADDSSVVLDLWEPDVVDAKGLDVTIETCPSVKRFEDSSQHLSPISLAQHQIPRDSG
ncbi:hypothetical protein MMC29_000047 [Sticta canariensis]|nr:hypothetical protein [Sticta canariensis]